MLIYATNGSIFSTKNDEKTPFLQNIVVAAAILFNAKLKFKLLHFTVA